MKAGAARRARRTPNYSSIYSELGAFWKRLWTFRAFHAPLSKSSAALCLLQLAQTKEALSRQLASSQRVVSSCMRKRQKRIRVLPCLLALHPSITQSALLSLCC